MRRVLIAVVLSFPFLRLLAAAEMRSLEVFGGFSAEAVRSPNGGCSPYNGWNVSVARRMFWKVSLVADFGGHYGRENEVVDNHVHTFLFGPRLALHNGRIAPFVHVLFGMSRLTADSGGPVFTVNAFALGTGGGVDLRITRRWSVRMIQIDYLRRRHFGEPPDAGRVSGGVVFHFGE
jgi:hypothetical protein